MRSFDLVRFSADLQLASFLGGAPRAQAKQVNLEILTSMALRQMNVIGNIFDFAHFIAVNRSVGGIDL